MPYKNPELAKANRRAWYLEHREASISRATARRKQVGRNSETDKAYYQKNRETIIAKTGEWARNNRDKRSVIEKRSRSKHIDRVRATEKAWYVENKQNKTLYRKSRLDYFAGRSDAWRKRNPDKVRAAKAASLASGKMAEYGHRRRARTSPANGATDCSSAIKSLKQETHCHYCLEAMQRVTIDHVTPLSRGGTHTPDNLVAACGSCNSRKHTKLVSEWQQRRRAA